jgi:hypothetical protein
MFKLSPSSISLMEECPRCFWLDKHEIWKRPMSIFPSLPSGMDSILKIHFDKFRDKKELPPELCNKGECNKMKLFDDIQLLNEWRDNRQGIKWQDEEGNILMGAVDNILEKNGKLIVLDYKTRGFPLKEDTHKYYQNQMDIYTFLLQKNKLETEDYALLLFYIPKEVAKTGEIIFDTSLIKLKVDVKNADYLFKKAIKVLNSDCPEDFCEWCELVDIDMS